MFLGESHWKADQFWDEAGAVVLNCSKRVTKAKPSQTIDKSNICNTFIQVRAQCRFVLNSQRWLICMWNTSTGSIAALNNSVLEEHFCSWKTFSQLFWILRANCIENKKVHHRPRSVPIIVFNGSVCFNLTEKFFSLGGGIGQDEWSVPAIWRPP